MVLRCSRKALSHPIPHHSQVFPDLDCLARVLALESPPPRTSGEKRPYRNPRGIAKMPVLTRKRRSTKKRRRERDRREESASATSQRTKCIGLVAHCSQDLFIPELAPDGIIHAPALSARFKTTTLSTPSR